MEQQETVRDNDSLCTPEWILERVRKVLGTIDLDPCSNPQSTVGAKVRCCLRQGQTDGLAEPWRTYIGKTVFCNPPYSKPLPWAKRFAEAAKDGKELVWLGKLDPSTRWAAVLREVRTAECNLHGRVEFVGGLHKSGMFASQLVYSGPSPFLFCHVFQDVGDVRVFR